MLGEVSSNGHRRIKVRRMRSASARAILLCITVVLGCLSALPARALDVDAAQAHVDQTLNEILELVVASRPRDETSAALRRIIEESTAFPQLARYTAGGYWEDMSAAQRNRFTDTLLHYVAHFYAGQFRAFDGKVEDLRAAVHIAGAENAGDKGMLVRSEVQLVGLSIDWLVSDRSGKVAISDIVVGGISMAVTHRELVRGMLLLRRGNVDRLIRDLELKQDAGNP